MSDQAGTSIPRVDETTSSSTAALADKGKGKAPAHEPADVSMGEEEDSSENESGVEEPVSCQPVKWRYSVLIGHVLGRRRYKS
jgi:hypothetical protein